MYVPGDSLNGLSPERRAALHLKQMFTYLAARVVLFQVEGPGGPGAPLNSSAHATLSHFLQNVPITADCDEWIATILKTDRALGMRLMDVRSSYCDEFGWATMQKVVQKETNDANSRLMRQALEASLQASMVSSAAAVASGSDLEDAPGSGR